MSVYFEQTQSNQQFFKEKSNAETTARVELVPAGRIQRFECFGVAQMAVP